MRPQTDTATLVAFCSRRNYPVARWHTLTTDGTTLYEVGAGGGRHALARWTDDTRIVITDNPSLVPDPHHVKRFLDYWCGFYHIGVSFGSVE